VRKCMRAFLMALRPKETDLVCADKRRRRSLLAGSSGKTFETYTFTTGLELRFAIRIRFADEQDTIKTFQLVRRILPPLAAEPCPPSWTPAPRLPGC
jgi:hypothetical protein